MCTDMTASDLPQELKRLDVVSNDDCNSCQVKWKTVDGLEGGSITNPSEKSASDNKDFLALFKVFNGIYDLLIDGTATHVIDSLYVDPHFYMYQALSYMPVVSINLVCDDKSELRVNEILLEAPRFLVYLNSDSDNVRVDRIVRCTPGTRHICLLSSLNYRGKIIPAGEYSFDDHCELIVPYSADEYAPTAGVPLTKAQAEDGTYFKGEVIKSPVSSELPGAFAASEEDDDDESSISSSASSKSIKPAVYDSSSSSSMPVAGDEFPSSGIMVPSAKLTAPKLDSSSNSIKKTDGRPLLRLTEDSCAVARIKAPVSATRAFLEFMDELSQARTDVSDRCKKLASELELSAEVGTCREKIDGREFMFRFSRWIDKDRGSRYTYHDNSKPAMSGFFSCAYKDFYNRFKTEKYSLKEIVDSIEFHWVVDSYPHK